MSFKTRSNPPQGIRLKASSSARRFFARELWRGASLSEPPLGSTSRRLRFALWAFCFGILGGLAPSGCDESECEKIIAISETCYSRYCVGAGAGTALCTCWENDMVLAGWTPGSCSDGIDGDSDGFTDCDDPDCRDSEACLCDDEEDNDDDGLVDCDDPDCARSTHCCHVTERATACCTDGLDNDGDGLTDCEGDPHCATAGDCCTDGEDNDGDGLVDCDDPQCATHPDCCAGEDLEACACGDGEDNDGDGLVDCNDDDCYATSVCWDVANGWHAEKNAFCVDKKTALDRSCHKAAAEDILKTFDCPFWVQLHRSGLPGRWAVANWMTRVDLRSDGVVDEESTAPSPEIEGVGEDGNTKVLKEITFYDDGWFDSNISRGVWSLRLSGGEPNGLVSIYFLSDACLSDWRSCDTDKPLSWRKDSDGGIMFYEYLMAPEGSRYVLSRQAVSEDFDGDGTPDRLLDSIVLERR